MEVYQAYMEPNDSLEGSRDGSFRPNLVLKGCEPMEGKKDGMTGINGPGSLFDKDGPLGLNHNIKPKGIDMHKESGKWRRIGHKCKFGASGIELGEISRKRKSLVLEFSKTLDGGPVSDWRRE
ncbi:hypothetical protein QYF36_003216 [Acer negundo]|nr:hypothetical protein QYF36_003216 [Acer negundo]